MKKILVIAYVFPPIAYAGSFRTLRLVKYLARMEYDITVLTLKEQPDLFNDYSLLNKIDQTIQIVRTSTIDFWRSYQKIKEKVLLLTFGTIIHKILSKLLYLFCLPDHMIMWVPFATFKGYRLLRKNRYDAIYTSSPPHSEQITGLILKKIAKCKWVADLRDPILDDLDADQWDFVERKIHIWLEKKVFANANIVVANTNTSKQILKKRYPQTQIEAIHNAFDEDDFIDLSYAKYDKFTIAHVGSIYNTRKTDILFSAIQELDREKKIHPSKFQILFVGLNNPQLQDDVIKYQLADYVTIDKIVPHQKALEIMRKSHVLLLIKGLGQKSEGQIPGKLFEYLATGNQILCIATLNSEAAKIIREVQAGVVFDGNPREIRKYLEKVFELYIKGLIGSRHPIQQRILNYSGQRMAQKFDQVLYKQI